MRQRYISQCPAAKGESSHGILLSGSLLRGRSDSTAIQQAPADEDGAMSRRGSERMARESCHGEEMSEWRGSHVTAKQ
jgi:hypothetical protein